MKDELLDPSEFDMETRSLMPTNPNFYRPNTVCKNETKDEVTSEVRGADHVIVADGDLDGVSASVLGADVYGEDTATVYAGPHGGKIWFSEVLSLIDEHAASEPTIHIVDIAVDDFWKVRDELSALDDSNAEIIWFDHHEWDDEVRESVEERVDRLEIDTGEAFPEQRSGVISYLEEVGYSSEQAAETAGHFAGRTTERCGVQMYRDYLVLDAGLSISDELVELAEVAAVNDLWLREDDEFVDERVEPLDDFLEAKGTEAFVFAVEENGLDIMQKKWVRNAVREKRDGDNELITYALRNDRLWYFPVEIDGESRLFVMSYGTAPTNKLAEELRQMGADAVLHIKPHGGVSLRGSEQFTECDTLAKEIGGLGHEKAAGGFPCDFGSLFEYAQFWVSRGESAREQLLEAIDETWNMYGGVESFR